MPRTPTKKGNEQKTQRTKRLKSTPTHSQDPCWRPAVFRRAPSAPARSVRVSRDSDPASGHEPCPKPNPNPFRDIRTIEPVPTGRPAWPQQRQTSGRVGHPVERDGQRALQRGPQTQSKRLSPCESMQPLPTPIPTSRSRCPATPFLSISGPFTNRDCNRALQR